MSQHSIASRARHITPSATVGIADKVSEMRRQGIDVVDFSAGRAAEHTPGYIVRAAQQAMDRGDTHQTMARGKVELREACAKKLARDNALSADPETEILVTLGAKQGLFLAAMATVDLGDEVLVEDPGFVSYEPIVLYCGGVPVPVPLTAGTNFRWTREALAERVTPRTKGLILCSPQNPTGAVHTEEDLEAIASVAREHDLLVYADETYERITWARPYVSIATLPDMKDRTINLMGLTKSFSMGGWRAGFARARPELIDAMLVAQQHFVTCASSFVQIGAAVAYANDIPEEVRELWKDWEKRCRHVTSALDALPNVTCPMPEGAFYAWADVRALETRSEALAQRWLEEHHVAVVPGSAFGPSGEGYVRVTCVRSWEEIDEGLERLGRAMDG